MVSFCSYPYFYLLIFILTHLFYLAFRALFMCFWTWAKGLEDSFDSKNRQNLKDFISASSNEAPISTGPGADIASDTAHASALYYINQVSPNTSSPSLDESSDEKITGQKYHADETMELLRIPTCAVFHKLTPGQGVPHSFVGFVKQYPALPKVVVSIIFNLHSSVGLR